MPIFLPHGVGGRTNLTKTPFLVLFVILISASIGTASLTSAQLGTVPDWFRGVAGFWAEEKITTNEFLDGIEFLIDQEVIKVPGYVQAAEAELESSESVEDAPQEKNTDTQALAANAETIAALEERVAALETLLASMAADSGNVYFSGVNVHIRDGSGVTYCEGACNGVGNLIVGYDEERASGSDKSGSHNLIVGRNHNYPSYGGFVAGSGNTISGPESSVSGGFKNTASTQTSSVSGGEHNTSSGFASSVSGGSSNTAGFTASSVSGGSSNEASGWRSSVSGGVSNTASGEISSVSGGKDNTAFGVHSSVSGGFTNKAIGEKSSVSGGDTNKASGFASSVSGGNLNTASGRDSSVSGGVSRTATAIYDWVAGALVRAQ